MSQVAVVTGGASGMGLAIGHRLAKEGCRVSLLDLEIMVASAAIARFESFTDITADSWHRILEVNRAGHPCQRRKGSVRVSGRQRGVIRCSQ